MNRTHSKPSTWAGLAALILILTTVACQPAAQPEDTPLPMVTPATPDTPQPLAATPTNAPAPEPTPTGPRPEAEQVVALTREDLAQRLDIAEEAIFVRSVEPVTWPDASLSCPQPGMAYAQVLMPGFRVILEAAGQAYEYHTGTPQPVVLCEEDALMQDAAPAGSIEPGMEALVEQAREDLAQRLSVPVEQIAVLEAKAVVWPDASLGCPQPGMEYLQVLTEGLLIRLGIGPIQYEYHGGGRQDPFLCQETLLNPKVTSSPEDGVLLPILPGD